MAEKKQTRTVDVIIPTFKPDDSFRRLLIMLKKQTVPVSHILIINTEEQFFNRDMIRGIEGTDVFHIRKSEFDHAATRNMGASLSDADYLVYMTQDAMPADEKMLEELLMPFSDPLVKAAYARQIPRENCKIPEGLVRTFNYPPESHVRTGKDLEKYGIRTFFCSNVCAAYDHRVFRELHGFSEPCIFNEDMIYAGRLIHLGYSVAYAADARVCHSHNYSNMTQLHRNFDNGVSQAMHPEIFRGVPSEGEGAALVRSVTAGLRELHRGYLIPGFWLQCAFRLAGFRLGKSYRILPRVLVRNLSMNRGFWEKSGRSRSTLFDIT